MSRLILVVGMLMSATAFAQTLPTNSGGSGTATPPNTGIGAPVVTSSRYVAGYVGASFTYQIVATKSPTSYNATGLPPGLTINTTTGAISGKLTSAGKSTIGLSAANSAGTGTATLTLTVFSAPVITSRLGVSGSVGFNFYYQITATNQPTAYTATGLPAGLSISTSTGAITGKPTATGSSTVILTATNPVGSSGAVTLTITVTNPPPPAIVSPLTASGSVGANFAYQVVATNAPASYNATGLPAGLSINPVTGSITGTLGVAGKTIVTLSATNAGGTGAATLTLTFTTAPVIVVQPRSRTVIIGTTAILSVTAAGATSYQWQFNGAPLAGATRSTLTLANVQTASAGNYTVVVSNAFGSILSSIATLTAVAGFPAAAGLLAPRSQPTSIMVSNGATTVLGAPTGGGSGGPPASDGTPTTYQWQLDGAPIAGASSPRLVISNSSPADAGTYTCILTSAGGSTVTNPVTLNLSSTEDVGRLVNLSVLTGIQRTLTLGLVIGGPGTDGAENLLIRATGPALTGFGVGAVLPDPALMTIQQNTGATVAANSGWGANQSQVQLADAATGAFPLSDANSLDSALVIPLPISPGGYSVQVTGQVGDSGSALSEVYDYTSTYTPTTPRLVNFSCLTPIASGGTLTAGIVIGGSTAKTVLVRAIGPALAPFGVGGAMPDPQLVVLPVGSTTAVVSNAAWGGDPQVAAAGNSVGAFTLNDPLSRDSAVLVTLPPGLYTAQVSSVSGAPGTVLVEVYDVP